MHATTETPASASGRVPYWRVLAPKLVEHGYHVVPSVGKRVLIPNWTSYSFAPLDLEKYAHHNVSLLTAHTPALDVDCLDRDTSERIAAYVESQWPQLRPPVRVGKAPKFACLFQTHAPFGKCVLRMQRGEDRLVIEWLGRGQQIVAYGRHPDGHEYTWPDGRHPANTPRDELPIITEDRAKQLLAVLQSMLEQQGWQLGAASAPAAAQETARAVIEAAAGLPPMPRVEGLPDVIWRALNVLDPTPREQWISVGHHLKALEARLGDVAREAWCEWSRRSPAYQPGDEARWETFQPERSSGTHALQAMSGTLPDVADDFEVVEPDAATAEAAQPKAKRALIEWPATAVARAPSWLIRGVLERDSVGVVWGEPRSYKSFLVLDWLMSIGYGVDWQGHKVRQGRCVYICGEGRGGVMRRVRAWQAARGLPESLDGRLGISRGAIILNDEHMSQATQLIRELKALDINPSAIAIDTVARNMVGNENAQEDMNALVQVLDLFRRAFPGVAIILVHHANKQGSIRGSTVLVGAADFEYVCEREEKLGKTCVLVSCNKMKDAEEPEPMPMLARVVDLGTDEDEFGDVVAVTSLVLEERVPEVKDEEQGMDAEVLEAVRAANEAGSKATVAAVRKAVGKSNEAVGAALRALVDRGQLHGSAERGQRDSGYWLPEFDEMYG